jgi:3-oxoadipate enol-lactonase
LADLRGEIDRIAVPTLVVAGRCDPVTTVDDARFIAERVAGAHRVTLEASETGPVQR